MALLVTATTVGSSSLFYNTYLKSESLKALKNINILYLILHILQKIALKSLIHIFIFESGFLLRFFYSILCCLSSESPFFYWIHAYYSTSYYTSYELAITCPIPTGSNQLSLKSNHSCSSLYDKHLLIISLIVSILSDLTIYNNTIIISPFFLSVIVLMI